MQKVCRKKPPVASLSERYFRKQLQCLRNMEKATKPRRSKYWRNQWSKWGDRWRGVMGGDDAVKVDLSPFTLRDIRIYGRHLRFKSPRVLEPTLDESKQLLCLKDPDLGISASASLRSSLYEEVQQCVVFLWDEYAKADDSGLEEGAKALKRGLLEAIEEVESA